MVEGEEMVAGEEEAMWSQFWLADNPCGTLEDMEELLERMEAEQELEIEEKMEMEIDVMDRLLEVLEVGEEQSGTS